MIMPSTARRTGRPLAILSAALMSAFVLSGCVTTDQYASQICLDKGIAAGSTAFNNCVAEQRASIVYWDNRFEAVRGQNG